MAGEPMKGRRLVAPPHPPLAAAEEGHDLLSQDGVVDNHLHAVNSDDDSRSRSAGPLSPPIGRDEVHLAQRGGEHEQEQDRPQAGQLLPQSSGGRGWGTIAVAIDIGGEAAIAPPPPPHVLTRNGLFAKEDTARAGGKGCQDEDKEQPCRLARNVCTRV